MELNIKKFNELTLDELYEILKVRADIFVVEQNCVYQDLDDLDKCAIHIYLRDDNGIQAYLRLIEPGKVYKEAAIGRVLSKKRHCGLATQIILAAIKEAQQQMNTRKIKLAAQVYARSLYEKIGFRQCSDEFLEDGIPHIEMILEIRESS